MKYSINQSVAALCALLVSSSSWAVEHHTGGITDLLEMRLGYRVEVSEPLEMPVKGVYQVKFGDDYGYLLDNGRYLVRGDFIDLKTAKNHTEIAKRDVSLQAIASFNEQDMIIYPAKGERKATITVFTDTSCGYCRKLHAESHHLLNAGIQVQYLPFPRGSKRGPGYDTLRKVWCAKDRPQAMHVAKETEIGRLDNDGSCEQGDIVDKGFVVGNAIGVTGTPSMFTEDGEIIGGYVPYKKLIPMILK